MESREIPLQSVAVHVEPNRGVCCRTASPRKVPPYRGKDIPRFFVVAVRAIATTLGVTARLLHLRSRPPPHGVARRGHSRFCSGGAMSPTAWPPWVVMWVLAGVIFAGCKW